MCCYTEYNSISLYLESRDTLLSRIESIDLLIDKTILLMADNVGGAAGNISTYELDDGQVRIKTGYRSMSDLEAGLKSLERAKQLYVNKYNGRSVTLRDRSTYR